MCHIGTMMTIIDRQDGYPLSAFLLKKFPTKINSAARTQGKSEKPKIALSKLPPRGPLLPLKNFYVPAVRGTVYRDIYTSSSE